ncbi:MAG: alpha/beta hydrolase [Psychrobacter sp.]|nr:alpha/beta hydrolase [Psychrobacter sp.]
MKTTLKSQLKPLSFAVQRAVVSKLLQLPEPIARRLAGKPKVIDGQTLNLPLQLLLKLFSAPADTLASVAETRAEFDEQGSWLAQPRHPDIVVEDFKIAVTDGEIRLRRYRHRNSVGKQPALVFYHGGGYAAGSLKSHDTPCQHLAADGHCTVIAVDYRLAPEYPFPTPVNDGIEAFRHITAHPDKYGIDPARIAVGGDSAGGNLAAVVAQQTKHDAHPPQLQLLWVPWVDMSTERPSYERFASGLFLERAKMRWYANLYLPKDADREDPKISPIYGDTTGVAPAVVLVAGFDPLRDEGIAYAHKLTESGIDTTFKVYDSLPHPFINIAGQIEDAKIAFADATKALREKL